MINIIKEKSASFISIISIITLEHGIDCASINQLYHFLDERYSDYEIILVGHEKLSNKIKLELDKLLSSIPSVRYIQLSTNVSCDVAYSAGLENAIGDFIIFFNIHTDPIELIQKAIDACKSGSDIVIGTSINRNSLSYRFFRPLTNYLLRLIDYQIPKNATHFRCLSRRAANSVMSTGHFYHQLSMQIQKTGYSSTSIAYSLKSYKQKHLIDGARDLMHLLVFNSELPIRVMSFLGLSASILAFVFSSYALIVRLINNQVVSGWASTIFIISFFSIIIFTMMSFILEYLGRILVEIDHKNSFSIVYEKDSSVMINQDRINVLNESQDLFDVNFVQTGRNN